MIMATINVSLPQEMKLWAERQTANRRYNNVSDYVCDLIRRDQQCQKARPILQNAVDEGLEDNTAQNFNAHAFKNRMRQFLL